VDCLRTLETATGRRLAVRRSGWVSGVTVLQFLVALLLLALPAYLIILTVTSDVRNAPNAKEDVSGLRVAAAVFIGPALLAFVAWYGLLKNRLWGWWVAMLDHLATTGLMTYSSLDDGWRSIDWESVGIAAMFATMVVFLLLPPVKRFYWESGSSSASVSSPLKAKQQ